MFCHKLSSLLVLAALSLSSSGAAADNIRIGPPPPTPTRPVTDTLHGTVITDPYRWLEDQDAADTRAWLEAQTAHTDSILHSLPGRDERIERFEQLLRTDQITMPTQRGDRFFYYKREADQELYSIYMRDGLDGREILLLDPHALSDDLTTSVGFENISEDGRIMAYYIREGGADETVIRLMNVETGEDLPLKMPEDVYFGFAMTHDMSGIYYSRRMEAGSRVYYHKMGTSIDDDIVIFGQDYGPDKIIGCWITADGQYLIIGVSQGSSGSKDEIYYKDLASDGDIEVLVNDIEANFSAHSAGDMMLLETNWKAPNGRVLALDMKNPGRENWQELVSETESPIQSVGSGGGKIFINYLENMVSRVAVYNPDGAYIGDLPDPAPGSIYWVRGRWESPYVFYIFSSFHVPWTTYMYNVPKEEQIIWHQPDIPFDSEDFTVRQVWYESKDGTRVPMFLMHRKGLEKTGDNPVLLTAYGGFRASQTPSFSAYAATLAEKGGIYATPGIRGGGEFGEEWHRDGMLDKKQNTFDDFIAAAEWLIESGYTNPSRLAIRGGSNGGLLVGAAMTQRPDLYQAVICTYPLLDMLRYHKFLMGPYWISEYGSADDPGQFEYIYAYSPYHRVEEGTDYPAVLFISGDSDTRVDPMHARKMTALVQAATASKRPVLLKYDIKTGHSGGSPVSKTIMDMADAQGFLYWQLGIE